MINTIFASKVGMTNKFTEKGDRIGVTELRVLPMEVESLRSKNKHGYFAIRMRIVDSRFKDKFRWREIRTEEQAEPGTKIHFDELLKVGDLVNISGVSKGKGFAGPVKRYNFRGGPRSHGQSDRERSPGSSGSGTTPGRVFRGKRRAGHMGVEKITVPNLRVLEIHPEVQSILISGSVPGNKKSLLTVTKV